MSELAKRRPTHAGCDGTNRALAAKLSDGSQPDEKAHLWLAGDGTLARGNILDLGAGRWANVLIDVRPGKARTLVRTLCMLWDRGR